MSFFSGGDVATQTLWVAAATGLVALLTLLATLPIAKWTSSGVRLKKESHVVATEARDLAHTTLTEPGSTVAIGRFGMS